MRRSVKRAVAAFAAGLLLLFTIFVVNQVTQLVGLAGRVSPVLGTFVLWFLAAVLALCLLGPLYLLLRLPRTPALPVSDQGPEFDAYLNLLRRRLRRNPYTAGLPLETRGDIEAALKTLGEQADKVIRETALQVFVSTAIWQNGSLDALTVLVAQSRMVYRIACIYHQRPALDLLLRLYANVAVSAFFARQLEESDLVESLQPVIAAALTSTLGTAFSGASGVMSVFTASLLSGSANAYLTLRVGVIAKAYCGSLVRPHRTLLAQFAAAEAAKMIPGVAREASVKVARAFGRAVGAASGTVFKGAVGKVKEVSEEVRRGFTEGAASLIGKVFRPVRRRSAPTDGGSA